MARKVTIFRSILLVTFLLTVCAAQKENDPTPIHKKGYCVWYDQCTSGDKALNCVYNGPAKNMSDPKGLRLLNSICPEFRGQHTCCSTKQLEALSKNLQTMAQLTTRCPACWNNMRRLYCQLTCNQDQSLYMDPSAVHNETKTGLTIDEIKYYVAPTFKQGLFDSCKDVNFPGNNEKALNLLCGTTAEKCTAQKLIEYMGNTDNGFAPFKIHYPTNLTGSMSWMNETIFTCNKPFVDPQTNKTASACSCQDCVASCPARPSPPPQATHRKIMGLDVLSFSLLVTYIILFLIFFPVSILCTMRKNSKRYALLPDNSQANLRYSGNYPPVSSPSEPEMVDSPPGLCERLGSKLESVLRHGFTKWGVWCSTHPYYVMGGSLVVVAILACGLIKFTVVTDPVDLWSAPDSTARKQKEIFDSKFGPFYRTEQLIIRSTHPTPAGYSRYGDGKWIPFGSIFHLDLLNQALELQNHITNMKVPFEGSNITLEDICFQPLAPQTKKCTIQSIFQYFQNNQTKLNKCLTSMGYDCDNPNVTDFRKADFHDHVLFCTRSPTSVNDENLKEPCLGAYGGPVNPNIALGGFSGTAYEDASTMIITFVVNNHQDKSKLTKQMAWEKAFLDYMKDYVKDPANGNLTISFSAERAIQDELDRESDTDIITIFVSYMIMFLYITVALGQFKSCSRILIDSKITLGFSGILIVLFSVVASLGFWSYIGEPATLIIIEVVPFLVLAVGVDNIFILVQAYQRQNNYSDEDVPHKVGRVLGEVAPSMLLTSLSESVAFALGAMSTMPAVRIFSLYAAAAVFFDFLLQVTAFVALLSLDAKRQENNRLDVLCCVKEPKYNTPSDQMTCVYTFMKDYFAEGLLSDYVRPVVVRRKN
ncbi:hypothetical protein ACROYT_G032442 [Oculina patagonica]